MKKGHVIPVSRRRRRRGLPEVRHRSIARASQAPKLLIAAGTCVARKGRRRWSMNIVRWDPFRELDGIQARLNRMFGERPFRGIEGENLPFAAWAPAVDIQETDTEYVIKADLPEVKKDDVKVELEDGVLTVEGERKQEKEQKGKKFHKIEREYGRFVRRFALPTEVDAAKLSAEFKDGVLNVHLPKSSNGKPKAISVKVA
jgi:HSP20 family protein